MCGCLSHALPTGTWPETQACVLTGNQTSNPLVHRLVLNPLSHTSQGNLHMFKATSKSLDVGELYKYIFLNHYIYS